MSLIVGAVGLFIGLSPPNLFGDFDFRPMPLTKIKSVALSGFTWNTNLDSDEPDVLAEGLILGPESIAIAPGSGLWYTGSADGYIKEVNPKATGKAAIRNVVRHHDAKNCDEEENNYADECGRYLQLRFHNDQLYAIEANTGLYLIDIESKAKILKAKTPASHRKYFYNSFTFDPKLPNMVYITMSSTRWDLQNIMWSFLENEFSGYLIAKDLVSGKTVRFLQSLAMVNGIDVDVRGDRLIYSETLAAKVSALDLGQVRAAFKSADNGQLITTLKPTVLLDSLPGNPDNVMVQGDTAFIAVPIVQTPFLESMDYFLKKPAVRIFLAKSLFMLGRLCKVVNEKLGSEILARAHRELVSGLVIYKLAETRVSAVVEYNLRSGAKRLHGSDIVAYISEAQLDHQGNFVLGSFRNPWIQRVKYIK